MAGPRLCLGVIVGAHGLRGQVKVKSFTEDPADLAAYGPLSDVTGSRTFTLSLVGRAKGTLLASIVGVTERNAAEALRGTELFVAREALPDTEDEEVYYHADLIGLTAEDESGMRGAADILLARGCRAVLVKGGHLSGDRIVDLLEDLTVPSTGPPTVPGS